METRRINKLVMFLAVCKHCSQEESADALRSVPAFFEAWEAFHATVDRLRRRVRLILKLAPTGTTEDKANLRLALATEAAKISAAIVTWAKVNGNAELAHGAHVTKSNMLNGRDVEAADRADNLLELAEQHAGELSNYGIAAQRLRQFDDLSAEYSELIGRPRAIIAARRRANRSIPSLFAEADEQLGHMDRLSILVEEEHQEFIEAYRESRRIVNVSATRALSDVEKASAAERQAKEEIAQEKRSVEQAAKAAERETSQGKARASIPKSVTATAGQSTRIAAEPASEEAPSGLPG